MQFQNAWHILQEDSKHQKWRKEHPETILSYAFISVDKDITEDWQIGYYDSKTDKLTTFSIINGEVADIRTDDVFKEPGSKMLPINMDKVKLKISEIMKKIDDLIKTDYPQEFIKKKIIILQNLKEYGLVWNITMISLTMNSINVKINAETGEIKAHKIVSLMDYKSKEPF